MVELPDAVRRLLEDRTIWHFVTVDTDGRPSATPVWVDVSGDHVLVNTAIGRRKERNVRGNRNVALATVDPDDPYSWVEIRGRVVDIVTGAEADDSIARLMTKYLGRRRETSRAGPEQRVLLRIAPDRISSGTESGSRGGARPSDPAPRPR
ncbi:MAG TPA: TIGR03618 family F420-dependent PPOX class oxidoreductase [Acidimicrobiales bacterium]|nr:TIGR03618 family F420-dependent PPOX class oxidoreductase [Acidimicrobiales bacterium]